MIQLIIGSVLLSITHAFIPNHWFPLAAVSKSENWTKWETARITALTAALHTISTIIIGIIIGFIGYKLGDSIELFGSIYAPVILIGLGLFFVLKNLKSKQHTHCHIDANGIKEASKKSKKAIITALGTMMFFSPCVEIEAYYFTAGQFGWFGIALLSVIYLVLTVVLLVIMVHLGRRSLDLMNKKLHFLESNEKMITGVILIVLGILSFFITV